MPQKKSSQLYSVSPKSFVRSPQKKRKKPKKFLLPLVVTSAFLLLLLSVGGFYFLTRNTIVSPLPVGLGTVLPASRNTGEKELSRLLRSHSVLYTSVSRTGEDYIITLNPKQQVVLSKKKDLTEQISSLQIILPRLTMEGKQFVRLDLRYDKPVVVY